MNRKWVVTLLLLLNAACSNLYCPKNSNVDTYIEDYLNNNPITETVSTNQLDTTPIAHQSTLKIMPQHIPVPAALPLINTASLTTPAGKIKNHRCSHCPKKFTTSSSKNEHERIHTGEEPYKCSHCPKSFKYSSNKNKHERIHTGKKPYKCSHCPTSFKHTSNKNKHERIHTGKKPYQCSHCPKSFTQSNSKIRHERIHTGEKPYKCSHCPKSFTDSSNKNQHEGTCKKRSTVNE